VLSSSSLSSRPFKMDIVQLFRFIQISMASCIHSYMHRLYASFMLNYTQSTMHHWHPQEGITHLLFRTDCSGQESSCSMTCIANTWAKLEFTGKRLRFLLTNLKTPRTGPTSSPRTPASSTVSLSAADSTMSSSLSHPPFAGIRRQGRGSCTLGRTQPSPLRLETNKISTLLVSSLTRKGMHLQLRLYALDSICKPHPASRRSPLSPYFWFCLPWRASVGRGPPTLEVGIVKEIEFRCDLEFC